MPQECWNLPSKNSILYTTGGVEGIDFSHVLEVSLEWPCFGLLDFLGSGGLKDSLFLRVTKQLCFRRDVWGFAGPQRHQGQSIPVTLTHHQQCHLTYHPVPAADHGHDDLVLEVHRDEQRRSNCRENRRPVRGEGASSTPPAGQLNSQVPGSLDEGNRSRGVCTSWLLAPFF